MGVMVVVAVGIAGCGSSGSSSKKRTTAAKKTSTSSLAVIGACLQRAGFSVTTVPASLLGPNDEENRGPGQTGELMVGPEGSPPQVGASNPALAVVASWGTAADAAKQVAQVKSDNLFAEAAGLNTIQPDAASPAQFTTMEPCLTA